ncbi:MAG TPA: TPM domain-containing protein [Thermoanaerobaculia bacterium]|nr:TPM domain-containing protein [Thermoanaerobaculia bacterium]
MKDEVTSRHRNFILHPSSFILLLCLAFATAAPALEVPPAPTQWVTDRAGLLTPSDAAALNQKLKAFEQASGAQLIIYTLPSLEGDAVESFTIRAVDRWKVGQDKYDNGLVLFVFRDERTMRIETGYGLEGTITDAFASRVIREVIAPHFAQGQWAAGLNAGADALMAQIRTGEAPVEPMRRTEAGEEQPATFGSILFMLVVFALIFFVLPMLGRRRRAPGCGGCFLPLLFLPGGGGMTFGGHRGGFGGGRGGFGGFRGGGGGFGGGGATGGW